jgi:hypothetical protein
VTAALVSAHRSFSTAGFPDAAAERTHAPPSDAADGLPASAVARPPPPASTHLRWVRFQLQLPPSANGALLIQLQQYIT